VPFTSVYYTLENTGQKTDTKIQTIHKLNTTQKKQTQKQNYPGLVAAYDTRPGNEVGLFYKAPEPTRGHVTLNVRKHKF